MIAPTLRLRRLERDGLVRGYRADVAPEAFGISLQAFVVARLKQHSQAHLEVFERAVLDVPAVVSCYHITGPFDYLLRLAARDMDHFGGLLKLDMAAVCEVARLETLIVLTEVKADAGWPVFDGTDQRRGTTCGGAGRQERPSPMAARVRRNEERPHRVAGSKRTPRESDEPAAPA